MRHVVRIAMMDALMPQRLQEHSCIYRHTEQASTGADHKNLTDSPASMYADRVLVEVEFPVSLHILTQKYVRSC